MIPEEVLRILEFIERDSRKKTKEILRTAKHESKKIRSNFEEISNKERSRLIKEYERKADQIKSSALSEAEIKNKSRIKELKSSTVDEIKRDAISRITGKGYDKLFFSLMDRSVQEIGKKNLEVFIRKEDLGLAESYSKKTGITISISPIKTSGGVMIKSGKTISNNLLDSIMERKTEKIDYELNGIFFSG